MRKLPLPTNRVARVRVLKNRACYNHLSARMGAEVVGGDCCVIAYPSDFLLSVAPKDSDCKIANGEFGSACFCRFGGGVAALF